MKIQLKLISKSLINKLTQLNQKEAESNLLVISELQNHFFTVFNKTNKITCNYQIKTH